MMGSKKLWEEFDQLVKSLQHESERVDDAAKRRAGTIDRSKDLFEDGRGKIIGSIQAAGHNTMKLEEITNIDDLEKEIIRTVGKLSPDDVMEPG
ncbi:MAG: hypothetical protein KIT79_06610, partial [Deltaproteobacteria bacterium]|nr:hypothetical protein [Deltaproteobacteria bacterium]